MRKELEEQLVAKHPKLFTHYKQDPKLPMYWGIECGDGWFTLISQALDAIQRAVNEYPEKEQGRFVLHQIKEKFGTLRIYMSDSDGSMNHVINDAYIASLQTCVWCGIQEGVTQNEHSFVRSMCEQCMIEYARNGWSLNGDYGKDNQTEDSTP